MSVYSREYERSISDPEGFWADQAGLVDWFKRPSRSWPTSVRRSTDGSPTPP